MKREKRILGIFLLVSAVLASTLAQSCPSVFLPRNFTVDGAVPKGIESARDRRDAEILANKWLLDLETRERYGLYTHLKLAVLMDPFLHETYARLGLDGRDGDAFIRAVKAFARNELFGLQAAEAFRDEPGRMPWGEVGILWKRIIYRRHLPSDMQAMSAYTGKISAGCESLSLFLAGLFRLKGVPAEDIVHLRLWGGHTVALVRYRGSHYYISNTDIDEVNPIDEPWLLGEHNVGIFGETFAEYTPFILKEGAFAGRGSLVADINESSKLGLAIGEDRLAGLKTLDPGIIRNALASNRGAGDPDRARLADFASQFRDVDDLSVYLSASHRGPLAKKLASRLKGPAETLEWVRSNIREGSIFSDGDNRVLMADQTIVYGTGTALDRAVLAYTLLTHQGENPRLAVENGKARVTLGEGFSFSPQ